MANGNRQILPPLQQQPGALEQFLTQLQQSLPQGLQQLAQQQKSTEIGRNIPQNGGGGLDPIENLIAQAYEAQQGQQPAQQGQQQDTSQEMIQTLQQLGVQPSQQTPQEMLGSLLQQGGMQQGRDLQGMLQQLQNGENIEPGRMLPTMQNQQPGILERTPSQTPSQEAAETYQELQQKPEPQREEHPSPLNAEMHPIHTPEQLRYLQQNVLATEPGRQLMEAKQRRDQLEALRGQVDDEKLDKAIEKQDTRINNLQQRQAAIDNQHQDYLRRINEKYEGAMEIAEAVQELRQLDPSIQSNQNKNWWLSWGKSILHRGDDDLAKIGSKIAPALGYKVGGLAGGAATAGLGAILSASYNLDMYKNPDIGDAEQFQSQLKRGMRQVYGKQLGDKAVEDTFGKMRIVMQSPELRERFYNHLQKVAHINTLEKKYADEVLEANNDHTTSNIENYTQRMTADEKRKAYQEFQQLRRDIIKAEKQQEQQGKSQQQPTEEQRQAQRQDAQLDLLLERA